MKVVIQIIGIIIILVGILYFLRPGFMKTIMEFFKKGKRIYFAGVIRFALAIVFFLAARECDITWVIVVFGILFIISGMLIFMLRLERLKSIIDWYQKRSILLLRVFALITLAIGAIILYAA